MIDESHINIERLGAESNPDNLNLEQAEPLEDIPLIDDSEPGITLGQEYEEVLLRMLGKVVFGEPVTEQDIQEQIKMLKARGIV